MATDKDQIKILLEKLQFLSSKQDDFANEIANLKNEIDLLKSTETKEVISKTTALAKELHSEAPQQITEKQILKTTPTHEEITQVEAAKPTIKPPKSSTNLEKFIGENLINKIGIIITVIGVSFGVKYVIDHDLISPLTRIILGYLFGLGLLGVAFKLKEKYTNFSAVLLSGSMAILYFITYTAYSYYNLFPQSFAFVLMVLFTIFTVLAALKYDKQIIAHIGLVGAYAVPFLLSNDTGNVLVLFSYMALINIGILFIAFKKYWKPLYYVAFALTWLIYLQWFEEGFIHQEQFTFAFTFLSIFFSIFYVMFLAYKLLQKEIFDKGDILLLLVNSFLFFGIGYLLLDDHPVGQQFLGGFALLNAIIHFVVSSIIYKQKLGDKNLFYFVTGLVLTFLTITIPIQLDGNWVTLLWITEAALLFWIGRSKKVPVYEKLAYPLVILAFISIIQDWGSFYDTYNFRFPETMTTPFFNIQFLSSLLFSGLLGYMNYLKIKFPTALINPKRLLKIATYLVPAFFILALYFSFRLEIYNYWQQAFRASNISTQTDGISYHVANNYDLKDFRSIWILNYTLLFLSLFSFANFKWIKNKLLGYINLIVNLLAIVVFLIQGLYLLSELRESYIHQDLAEYYKIGSFNIWFRYVSFIFVGLALYATYRYIQQKFMQLHIPKLFDLVLHGTILWIASSELISWMDLAAATQSYKFGLSILWGLYAALLIAFGIWKNKKHLRIGAFVLFAITLIKLFIYDISELNNIAKTVAFVSLGVLLLIISFLYNKYKNLINDDED